jgi:hypothetical protein
MPRKWSPRLAGAACRRISTDRIGDEGSHSDQADPPDADQDPPDFVADTGQAHQPAANASVSRPTTTNLGFGSSQRGPSANELMGCRRRVEHRAAAQPV